MNVCYGSGLEFTLIFRIQFINGSDCHQNISSNNRDPAIKILLIGNLDLVLDN